MSNPKINNFQATAWKPLVLASAISSLFVPSAFAAQEEIQTLAPVVVTASRIEQPQTDALPHTTVITKEEIQNSGASDVISLLNKEAGIEITQSGGAGMQTSVFMRGTNANQTLILIDGVPVQDPTQLGTAAPLEHMLPDQIERIEIVRGNVSAIYGSRAIGGVIQIFTKRGSGKPAIHFAAEAGSRGTARVSGGVSGQVGKTRYALSLTRLETDGFSAMNTDQFSSENPDDDGDKNLSVTAALSHEWQSGQELGLRVYTHDAEYDYDNAGFGPVTRVDDGTSKQHTIALFSKNRLSAGWLSTLTLSETEIKRSDNGIDLSVVQSDTCFKSTAKTFQWVNEIMLSSDWTMTAGIDVSKEKADIYSYYAGPWGGTTEYAPSRSNRSIYAGLNGRLDKHSMQFNLRYDDVGDSGSDTTWYLGYGYALTPKWKLVASTSSAFLAPNLYQLYDPSYGNSDLKAERALTHEVGLQYATGRTLIRATLFDFRTRDALDTVEVAPFTYQYANIDMIKNHGFELSASSMISDVDIRASLTLQNPEDDTSGERLSRRAKTLASLGLSKQLGMWRVGGDAHYVGHRRDGSYELPSYWLFNLNVDYQISKAWSVYGRIENLFDKEYQTVYGYDQPSRGIFVGIRWNQQ